MIILNNNEKVKIFKSDKYYLQSLHYSLACLVRVENYEKAAILRDIINYENIKM
jgi:protein-arginine kinase activator protein McsA